MKLGFFTAALGQLSLEQVADWAAANGFEALEVACWPSGAGSARRYAGVCHIDVETLDDVGAERIRSMLAARDLSISSLGFYPNHLDPNPETRAAVNAHLKKVIDAAQKLGIGVVGTFVGRDKTKSLPENLQLFSQVWPELVSYAGERGIKIAIENCPMIFSYDEWPGGTNLASTPAIWREMFRIIPDANFGLNLDPSHLVWQMIDYERCVYDFKDRIFHAHAKDMEIRRDGLYENGVLSLGMGWQVPRLPGLGEVRWDRFIAALYAVGYNDVLSIEHEDRKFEGSEELVKRGFLIARNVLKPYLV
ncbi:sugar phosphate isomerase/epimerase [Candidatus Gracilibacteria bacterium]|nr:sugar phosphate isomerase/epimerase [Candidatus Gracilibacteria bacterium]